MDRERPATRWSDDIKIPTIRFKQHGRESNGIEKERSIPNNGHKEMIDDDDV